MRKLMIAAVVLSATAAVAGGQSAPNAESRQMAAPNASNDAVRNAVMATSQTKPVHAQRKAPTGQRETLSEIDTSSGAEAGASLLKAEPGAK